MKLGKGQSSCITVKKWGCYYMISTEDENYKSLFPINCVIAGIGSVPFHIPHYYTRLDPEPVPGAVLHGISPLNALLLVLTSNTKKLSVTTEQTNTHFNCSHACSNTFRQAIPQSY